MLAAWFIRILEVVWLIAAIGYVIFQIQWYRGKIKIKWENK